MSSKWCESLNLKAHLQWHGFSKKTTPPKSPQMVLPTGKQAFKYLSLWETFPFKQSQVPFKMASCWDLQNQTDPMFLLGYYQCSSNIKDEACVKEMRIQFYNHKELVHQRTRSLENLTLMKMTFLTEVLITCNDP